MQKLNSFGTGCFVQYEEDGRQSAVDGVLCIQVRACSQCGTSLLHRCGDCTMIFCGSVSLTMTTLFLQVCSDTPKAVHPRDSLDLSEGLARDASVLAKRSANMVL